MVKISKRQLSTALGLSFFAFLSSVSGVRAADVDIGKEFGGPLNSVGEVGGFVSRITTNLYYLAGIILFVLFLYGGFEIIRGAGSDDRDMVGRGRKIITAAIGGFLLIFASYWIIQLIELLTGQTIF